jgi:hypothetical protein
MDTKNVAKAVAWLLAIHPLMIGYSCGLMRDSTVALVGWSLVLTIVKFANAQRSGRWSLVTLFSLLCIFLASLRVISFVGFLALSGGTFLVFSRTNLAQKRIRRSMAILTGLFLLPIIIVGLTHGERVLSVLDYANAMRSGLVTNIPGMEDINQNGLVQRLYNISPLMLLPLSPLQIMEPFPFFNWVPPYWIGGPVRFLDVVIGLGGLFSQVFFGFFAIGTFYWWRTKAWGKFLLCGAFIIITGWLNIVGLGQVRYMMAHVYPFYFYGVVTGVRVSLAQSRRVVKLNLMKWIAVLGLMYMAFGLFQYIRG